MKLTSKTCRAALFLMAIFGTAVHAQAPLRFNRPTGVPQNYVITPNGYFHPSCIHEVKVGEVLITNGRIRHADGSIENVPACGYPHYSVRGQVVLGAVRPTISGWVEYASTTTSASFGELTASWIVPPAPTSDNGETVFFFPGMEDINDVVTIIQPVLQYGQSGAGGGNYWSIASWNCCVSGTTYYSTLMTVNAGDEIGGTIKSTCAAGLPPCTSWDITTSDETGGFSTTLSNSSSEGQTFNWAFAGVMEVYSVTECSDYPPNAAISFSNIALYDNNFSEIAAPAWSITNESSGLSPQCSYGATIQGPTGVTLDYGTHLIPIINLLLQ